MNASLLSRAVLTMFLLASVVACGGGGSSGKDDGDNASATAKAYTAAVNQVNTKAVKLASAHDTLFGPQSPLTTTAFNTAHDGWLDAMADYADAIEGALVAAGPYQARSVSSSKANLGKSASDEFLSLVPGTDSGIGLSTVKEMRDSVQTARDTRAKLEEEYQAGLIDEQEYRAAVFRESQAQAGRLVIVGGAAVGGAFVSTVGGLAAGATGLSLLPVIAVGTLTGYVGGKVFSYLFTSSQDGTDSCTGGCTIVSGQSDDGTILLPAGETGTLTIAQEDSQPVSIGNIRLNPEVTETIIHVDAQPDNEPFESAGIRIEENQEEPSALPTCADIASLTMDFTAGTILNNARLTVNSIPPVEGCEILVSGQVEASAPFGTMPIRQTIRTGEDVSFGAPAFGDYLLSVQLQVLANGLDTRLSRYITQPEAGISLIEPVSPPFSVAIGERLDLGHLYVRLHFADGARRVVSAVSDPFLTWQMQNNKGALADGFFTAAEPGVAEFLVAYDDGENAIGSGPYTVNVEGEISNGDEVITGLISTLYSTMGGEKSHCVSYSQYPLSWSADDVSTFTQSCSALSGCELVAACPADWVNACEQASAANMGGAILNSYYYTPIGAESVCNQEGGVWKTQP